MVKMPIKEIPVKPAKGSNYSTDSHYGMTRMPNGNNRKPIPPATITTTTNDQQNKNLKNKIVINYENMFVSTSNTNLPYVDEDGNGNGQDTPGRWMNDKNHDDDGGSLHSQGSNGKAKTRRLSGGATRGQQKLDKLLSISPSQCEIKAPGMSYFEPKPKVNIISLSMMKTKEMKKSHQRCDLRKMQTKARSPSRRTRGTQSLYRESSAQTLPYLPAVSNDPDELESLELFKLPTILPGTGPPGLYEVEVLERARKRWAFAKALKENFRQQLAQAREEQIKLPPHDHILEAFEWEHWIEREENIQECQMLRLEILIRMFDQREREMRSASHLRIQQSCARIEAQRQAALRKNETEFNRAMRRLEMQHKKQPRHWRKEHISQGFGDPTSEFYAPKIRHGIDPSRRHFVASRKGFDMRMDDLERKTVKMDPRNLKCPFAKLRSWSKPKELVQEVEQNFCSENNLKKLYESLRVLRETSNRPKTTPLCLKAKEKPTEEGPQESPSPRSTRVTITDEVAAYEYPMEESSTEGSDVRRLREEQEYQEYLQEVRQEKQNERQLREHLQREMGKEEFEVLIQAYEGNTIGWLMRFLSEEMSRLKEQRKLHFYTMLAKRERWHREAAEAGLRQKENVMRDTYEKIYQECNQTNFEMSERYIQSILEEDIRDFAEQQAENHVVTQAKELDKEICGWLRSIEDVQTPMNYHQLRHALRDIAIPDVENILHRLERDNCVRYIINEVLLPQVYEQLESYDVSFSVATNFIDRLIDTDLHRSSSEGCCSECECSAYCSCSGAQKEARAILRKLIRHSVPGRRWRTSTERMVDENVKDILDEVFERVIAKGDNAELDMMEAEQKFSYLDLGGGQMRESYFSDASQDGGSIGSQDYCKIKTLGELPPTELEDVTKTLEREEQLLLADTDQISADKFIMTMDKYASPKQKPNPPIVHPIPSTHDISSVWDFDKTPNYCRTSSDDGVEEVPEESSKQEDIDLESIEISSSHGDYEGKIEEEYTEEENTHPSELGPRKIDSQVHFDDHPKVEEIIEPVQSQSEDDEIVADDDDVVGVIPVAFSYDPTVKFTVPVPSNFEMTMERHSDEKEESEEM
ncbi:cilia- and flagella-associated protein 91 [Musca domestica]|uniref:Cilia- and flagella-associated protein 91 n=1 Tax=Musca domestica TaxID=7370 RepID=A0A9J7DCS7_MUSDO|nr:cilia- and flagella-associated protein 91 [Musca domestica]